MGSDPGDMHGGSASRAPQGAVRGLSTNDIPKREVFGLTWLHEGLTLSRSDVPHREKATRKGYREKRCERRDG